MFIDPIEFTNTAPEERNVFFVVLLRSTSKDGGAGL